MTQRATITDSHCHLDFADFDAERDQIVARAVAAAVAAAASRDHHRNRRRHRNRR